MHTPCIYLIGVTGVLQLIPADFHLVSLKKKKKHPAVAHSNIETCRHIKIKLKKKPLTAIIVTVSSNLGKASDGCCLPVS